MSYQDLKPSELKSLPTFMRSSSPQVRFHSAFPPLTTTKRVKSVMERAGFDVYRPDQAQTPKFDGHRNFTAPGNLAAQKQHESDSEIQRKMNQDNAHFSSNSLPLDTKLEQLKNRNFSAGAVLPAAQSQRPAKFQLGTNSMDSSRNGSMADLSRLNQTQTAINGTKSHSASPSRHSKQFSGISQSSDLGPSNKIAAPAITTTPASPDTTPTPDSEPIFDTASAPPTASTPSKLSPRLPDTPRSKASFTSTEDDFQDASSSINEFDAKYETGEDSVAQLLSMRKELSPTPAVPSGNVQIPSMASRQAESTSPTIYNAQDIHRLNNMQSPEFKVYNSKEENNDMSTIQEDTEYDDSVVQMSNRMSRLGTTSPNSVLSPEKPLNVAAPEVSPMKPKSVVKYNPGEGPCRQCGLPIASGQKSIWSKDQQLSGQWHRKCFSCNTCSKPFKKGESCYVHEDAPYCELHFHEKNGSLCTYCGSGIEGECLSNEHGELFHVHCLKCSVCGITINNDYYVLQDKVLCENDGAIHLKTANSAEERLAKRRTRVMYL
ncbi:hypothetical protein OGAPHI_001905 [Ogataea philodendri]|uniref:Uncharacterized protein n=1 Tax=Ogataea philodendri TaxID=1378263 RepID=A0A9P8T7N4_9ASCO|nr:uncharacterized protein OGAPHI_001905 [Ogataea philodendri]KAH3668151.1 hypothetical protein OGAPHI_001905 [Ogataea philodendri]